MQKFDLTKLLPFYDKIEAACLAAFRAEAEPTPYGLLLELMDLPGLPMHCPPHHYIMPATLLTVVARKTGEPEDLFREQLAECKDRALNVLAGFCGWYGDCGAAVGIGIFMSVFTNADPHVQDYWADCNRATGQALLQIAEVDGSRCCKRNSFIALQSAIASIEKSLGIQLADPGKIVCKYHEENAECKKNACPFYPEEA